MLELFRRAKETGSNGSGTQTSAKPFPRPCKGANGVRPTVTSLVGGLSAAIMTSMRPTPDAYALQRLAKRGSRDEGYCSLQHRCRIYAADCGIPAILTSEIVMAFSAYSPPVVKRSEALNDVFTTTTNRHH